MNGVLLENFLTTFNYWFTWEEVGGLTCKGKSCLLEVSRMSNHRSFERSLGAGKGVETVSRSVSEESTYAKKKKKKTNKQTNKREFSLRKEMHFHKIYTKPFAQFRRQKK